ncbi:D-3-phosphoglycerate dehydrogenase [Microthyrium microscopicum]|uniref:D-3-phosphoglycerate dehydrogenase n=1 Tax=Microthyrium microscopicum TaxID=703497 RepID=A0A6A6UTI9_9PEZI|nr:D-3-phosphoglycerate dehydrogenase [Microthyrium microscopicum]
MAPLKLAILDDNQNLASTYFTPTAFPTLSITIFNDTLPPYSHPTTSSSDRKAIIARLLPFAIISTMRERTPFTEDLVSQLPNLKLLLVTGKRHNTFDYGAFHSRSIPIIAAAGRPKQVLDDAQKEICRDGAHATTQHTWALILGLARGVAREDHALKSGLWQTSFALGLQGLTLGVLGLGRLGGSTARIGVLAWGMKVVAWSSSLTQEKADETAKALGLPVEVGGEKTFRVVGKEELFRVADVVSVHYALSARSEGIVGREELGVMKKGALLVNTSRGPLIDEGALLETLEKGGIAGAALDVFDVEPVQKDHPYRSYKWGTEGRSELLLSPHMGYVEKDTLETWYEETAENLQRWLKGEKAVHQIL